MTYSEKLRNPKWQRKRLEILQRDNFKCCLCGDEETELHVHHLKYTGEPHEAPNEDLQTLCMHCHSIEGALKTHNLNLIASYKKNGLMINKFSNGKIGIVSITNENIFGCSILICDPKDFLEGLTKIIGKDIFNE